MGASLSRATGEIKESFSENKFPSAPILTPQIKKLDVDPRSPSCDISRTPIEVLKTPLNRNTTDFCKERNTFENIDCSGTDIDPRSPTFDFHRTPLIIKGEAKIQPNTLHNKNLDNARRPLVSVTPVKPKTSEVNEYKQEDTSPKLLETSTKFVKQVENKRNSFIGLLETNIDYVETDIDTAIQQKTSQSTATKLSPQTVERESNVVIVESTFEEPVKENTESVPKVELDTVNSETEHLEENGDVAKCIAELDRKLTNLIYEDKEIESSVKITKPVEGHRTPLGDRNTNRQHRRAIPVLKVNDKPTKLHKISKIPVFKEKRVNGNHIQCENTPPRMTNRSHWSTEDSLII